MFISHYSFESILKYTISFVYVMQNIVPILLYFADVDIHTFNGLFNGLYYLGNTSSMENATQ